ncbi:MAG: homoserine dehydrogenase [Anaerolineae bacterium]
MREIPIVILGLGNVGSALLHQILGTRAVLAQRAGLWLTPIGIADSQGLLLDPTGLPDEALHAALRAKTDGRPLSTLVGQDGILHYLGNVLQPGTILVDVTASPKTEPTLRAALDAGCGLVLANKIPLAGPWAKAKPFFEHLHLRYEATVGAGLPVISTLHYLLDTGDQVTAIEGCLSGTLGYLCTELERGVPYSAAVSQARSLGYTEPDPREDLNGRDVARKMLILARTAGWPLEMANLTVEPLYPERLVSVSTEEFMAATPTLDEQYTARIGEAQARGQTLRYVARVGPDGGEVGLVAVPHDSPLGVLRGPANYVALHTRRYAEIPLVLSGPGAGPEVTATGVLGDVINLASTKQVITHHAIRNTFHVSHSGAQPSKERP